MKQLSVKELENINGGAIKWGVIAAIGAGITFIIGVIDGIVRPLKCN